MVKSQHEELLLRAQFTKLIVQIQSNIGKLGQMNINRDILTELHDDFSTAYDKYIKSKHNLEDYLYFRARAFQIKNRFLNNMTSFSPDLQQIVGNIVLAILGLGVIYGLAVGVNYLVNGKFLFFQPEPVRRVEAVFNAVDALKTNPFAAQLST
ncbi:Uncharacterised protein (plasmid) [Legionella adelaidensis]|uniref:Uncharacterized protein n=1 Tax=Legionella adelaidensis TaxID=45056 RepID=A0A0W0R1D7_9GAMM|nr:hypothetical protein [Legionella adelaidensis]KTC64872.1 hypothetical protein Lade_2166 [Legionella adelaidensis]VEH82957.1 Uncharacterised protein [Legionella adelaidensis]